MLTTLEKAKALKEFRSLRVALTSGALKTLEKAKSLKRFRELRVLLGGDGKPDTSKYDGYIKIAADSIEQLRLVDVDRVLEESGLKGDELSAFGDYIIKNRPDLDGFVKDGIAELTVAKPAKVNLDQKEQTLPEQQAKLLANFPSITTFIDTAKMNGFDNAGVSWNGGYCMIPIGDGSIGNMVEVLFNVVGDDKGKLIVRRWNDKLSKYDDIASFGAYDGDTKNIQNAFVEAKKYVTANTSKDFTPLLNSIINGDVSAFDDSTKLTELVDAAKESGGDDMPEDKKGLFIQAIKAAGMQVLEGQGFELVD